MLLSSTSYITAAFTLASGHPGLQIKIWYYCTLYNSVCVLVVQSCLTLCNTIDYFLPGSSGPWNSLGRNTRVGSYSLLQGIFPAQGLNLDLPHCRQILYHLSHKGSPTLIKYCIIKYTKVQLLVKDECTCQCTLDAWTNLYDWTFEHTFTSEILQHLYVGDLTVEAFSLFPCTFWLLKCRVDSWSSFSHLSSWG